MDRKESIMGKILVTGASGFIGKRTLQHLLKRQPANQLVGLVRDPSKAEDLIAQGIELRQGDYLQPETLAQAFKGIDKVMLVSTHAFTDRLTAHGNAVDAAAKAGVKHIVYMPILRKPNSTFVMKEITNEDLFTEEKILASGIPYTFARHPLFLDQIATYIGAKAQDTGVRVTAGSGKFSPAVRDDLAAAHAAILSEEGHENKSYRLTGEPLISFSDIANILTDLHGSKVPYKVVSDEEYIKIKVADGWPDFVASFALTWVHGINAGEWEEQTGDLEKLIGRKPKTPTEFFRDEYLAG
jgi:NAD(P)H dehydrogenase (quinone)